MITYQQLTFSQVAQDNNICNRPTSLQIIRNLQQLQDTLNAMEQLLDVPLTINSAYRCPEVNDLVGGVVTSKHMFGLAADITVENSGKCTLRDLKNLCKELRKTRFSEYKEYENYVHIAIKNYF